MTIEFDSTNSDATPSAGSQRRRAAGALGATMLVAAAGGIGFGIGRSADSGGAISPAAMPKTVAPVEAEPTVIPTIAEDPPPPEPPMTVRTTIPADDAALETMEGDGDVMASGGPGWTMFGDSAMTLLAERITESGAMVRAHLGETWPLEEFSEGGFGWPGGWQPPAWCFESGQVRIALGGAESTGTSIIDVGSVSWWNEPFNGRAVSALTMGLTDANPYRVVFVQAPPSVTEVSVTFGDGATDSTAPTDGVALLAVPGLDPVVGAEPGWIPPPRDFEVTFVEPDQEPSTVSGDRTGYQDPEFQASCSPPPPALPEPGEQPADPAAEEQAVIDLMTAVYSDDDDGNDERFDDPTGIAEAREEVRQSGYEEAAANAVAVVEELVFSSPTEAWFRYRIETTTGIFSERYGIAVNIDGTWKITRETICQDLALAGGNCGGFIEPIRPPGS